MALPVIASATSIALVGDLAYSVTGTATIDTITGLKAGQAVTLVATGAFTLGSGGNIEASTTLTTADRAYTLVSDGTTLFEVAPAQVISDATESSKGIVELATDGETASGVVVQGNDARLAAATTLNRGTVLLAADGGTTAGTVVQANDSRLPVDAPAIYITMLNQAAGLELEASGAGAWKIPNGYAPAQYLRMSALGTPTSAEWIVHFDALALTGTNEIGFTLNASNEAVGTTVTPVASSAANGSVSGVATAVAVPITVSQLGTSDVWLQPVVKLATATDGPIFYHMALALYY